jgi:hypothetical protein
MRKIYYFFRRLFFDIFIYGGWNPKTWPSKYKNWKARIKNNLVRLLGGFNEGPNTNENISIKGVFNYGEVTEGQKSAVDEVLTRLKQDPTISFVLNDEYVSWMKKEFKIEKIDRFNIENSAFWQWANKRNIDLPVQGWIKEGRGKDAVEYPIIATNMDIRQYDKMMHDLIQLGKNSARNT